MKKFITRAIEIAKKLGFAAKMKDGKMTAAEQKLFFAEYEKQFGISFAADKEADEDDEPQTPPDGDDSDDDSADEPDNSQPADLLSAEEQREIALLIPDAVPPSTGAAARVALTREVVRQRNVVSHLAAQPEPAIPVATVAHAAGNDTAVIRAMLGRTPHSKSHIFGIEDKFFERGHWWNDIVTTRREIEVSDLSHEQLSDFKTEFGAYQQSFRDRLNHLNANGLIGSLDFDKMIADSTYIDYSDLFGKAGEYIVRRQDLIIAYLRSLPSVRHIFPVISNVQNKMISPGAHFGELSQGYRKGLIFKGNVSFTAEIYSVIDVMFKYLFDDMIRLEKQYIGDLNREGSNVIKWTFIEWVIVHFGTILFNEQQRRRVVGVRVPQQNVVSNPAMLAADGVLRAVERVEDELKVLPFDDLKVYDESTIVDYLESFYDKVERILPTVQGYTLYVNEKHRRWYIRNFREKYGLQTDFSGVKPSNLLDVSDHIVWIPNMSINNYKAFMTVPGNVENYEDKPFEMTAFFFERDWEDIRVISRWKEGSGLRQAGIQYKTLAELKASARQNQWIFTNWPLTQLAAGATTADATLNSRFLTAANTAATAITDITGASPETVYRITCGSLTNATTIAKAGKFAEISAAWTPVAVGDYIELYAELEDYSTTVDGNTITATRATGNFLELARKVSV